MSKRPGRAVIPRTDDSPNFFYPLQEEQIDAILRMRKAPDAIKTILGNGTWGWSEEQWLTSPTVTAPATQRAIKRSGVIPTPKDLFQAMQAGMRKRIKRAPSTTPQEVKMTSALPSGTGELTIKGKALHARIRQILEPQFISYDRVAYTMALALSCKQNVWFYGHGGYGKSTMIETVMRGLDLGPELFVQSFGQGMTPEKLVGNLDLKALNEENLMRFNVADSFMAKKYAIFEEMPDAAINVLFMLKDTLERRIFRDGAQQFPIQTQSIIVLSNRSPKTVAEYGVDAEALTQRFPFRESVEWDDHTPENYEKLFIKREATLEGPPLNGTRKSLAQILGDSAARGEPIPPRIAIHAMRAIKAAAEVRDSRECSPEDFIALRHVAGLEALGNNIEKEVAAATVRAEAEGRMRAAETQFNQLHSELVQVSTPIKALQSLKKIQAFIAMAVTPLKVTDELAARKDVLVQNCGSDITRAMARALELTV
jgi:MoxR-like ATPase